MGRILYDILIVVLLALILVVAYSSLVMSSKWDEISEEDWEEFSKMHNKEDKDE